MTFDIGNGKRIKVNGYAIKPCRKCPVYHGRPTCSECNPNQYKRGYWRVFKKTKDIIKKKYKYNKLNQSQVEKLKHITELLRDL